MTFTTRAAVPHVVDVFEPWLIDVRIALAHDADDGAVLPRDPRRDARCAPAHVDMVRRWPETPLFRSGRMGNVSDRTRFLLISWLSGYLAPRWNQHPNAWALSVKRRQFLERAGLGRSVHAAD